MTDEEILRIWEAYQQVHTYQEEVKEVEELDEAEVLAQKNGVAGSVKVRPALSIPGTDIGVGPNKPVPGTFTTTTPGQREKISKGDTTIDRGLYKQSRVGAGPTANERSRYNTAKVQQGSADRMKTEEVDLFDTILEHLVAEGYADTNEAALAIMSNMSEEWREEIVEGMTMKDFKANRRKLQRKQSSDDAKKRGHVDKFTGKPYGTEEAASRRRNLNPAERESRRKFAEDPD